MQKMWVLPSASIHKCLHVCMCSLSHTYIKLYTYTCSNIYLDFFRYLTSLISTFTVWKMNKMHWTLHLAGTLINVVMAVGEGGREREGDCVQAHLYGWLLTKITTLDGNSPSLSPLPTLPLSDKFDLWCLSAWNLNNTSKVGFITLFTYTVIF